MPVRIIPRKTTTARLTVPWKGVDSWEDLECLIEAKVADCLAQYDAPEYPTHPVGEEKWNIVSQLQKAIRRGQADRAEHCAQVLARAQRSYVVYRLSVIVGEEIGVADLSLNCMWLWIAQQKAAWWKTQDAAKVCGLFARRMAESVKSRETADVLNATENWPQYAPLIDSLPGQSDIQLAELANHEDPLIAIRGATHLLLRHRASKNWKGALTAYMLVVGRSVYTVDAPLAVRYATYWGLQAHRECQPAALPWVWYMHKESSNLVVARDVDVSNVMTLGPVGAYQSEALDKHTRDGKRAIAYFNAVTGLREKYKDWGIAKAGAATGDAVFRLEGDRVDRRLYRDGSRELNERGVLGMLFGQLGPDVERATEVLSTVWERRDELHKARLKMHCPEG